MPTNWVTPFLEFPEVPLVLGEDSFSYLRVYLLSAPIKGIKCTLFRIKCVDSEGVPPS